MKKILKQICILLLMILAINIYAHSPKEEIAYHFPSPSEIMHYIRESRIPLKKGLCNLPINQDKYIERYKQAVNMGIYMSDFAYLSVFGENQTGMQYLNSMQSLGYKLRIDFNAGKEKLSKYSGKKIHPDSIIFEADRQFGSMVTYCEQNNLSDIFSLITIGGYVECLYLSINYIGEYSEDNPFIEKVADQKFLFDTFMNYLQNIEKKIPAQYINDVNRFKEFYLKLPITNQKLKVIRIGGKTIVSGGSHYELNEQTFNELKTLVNEIRGRYVSIDF